MARRARYAKLSVRAVRFLGRPLSTLLMADTQTLSFTLGPRWKQSVNHPASEPRLARLIHADARLVAPTNILIDERFKAHEIAWDIEVQRHTPDGAVVGIEMRKVGSLSFMAPFKDSNTGRRHGPSGKLLLNLDEFAFSDLWGRVTLAGMRKCQLTLHVEGLAWEFPFEVRRWMSGMADALPIAQLNLSYS